MKTISAIVLAFVCNLFFYSITVALVHYALKLANIIHTGAGSHQIFNSLLLSSIANFIGAFLGIFIVGRFIKSIRIQNVFIVYASIMIILFVISIIIEITTFARTEGRESSGLLYPVLQCFFAIYGASLGKKMILDRKGAIDHFRWATFIPASIICSFLISGLVTLIYYIGLSRFSLPGDKWAEYFMFTMSFLALGASFVYIGSRIAPAGKTQVSVMLACIAVAFSLIMITLLFSINQWGSFYRYVMSSIGSIVMSASIVRGEVPTLNHNRTS